MGSPEELGRILFCDGNLERVLWAALWQEQTLITECCVALAPKEE